MWRYYDLPPTGAVFATQHPRPAQRCARCGLVRRPYGFGGIEGIRLYYVEPEPQWFADGAESPCEAKENTNG